MFVTQDCFRRLEKLARLFDLGWAKAFDRAKAVFDATKDATGLAEVSDLLRAIGSNLDAMEAAKEIFNLAEDPSGVDCEVLQGAFTKLVTQDRILWASPHSMIFNWEHSLSHVPLLGGVEWDVREGDLIYVKICRPSAAYVRWRALTRLISVCSEPQASRALAVFAGPEPDRGKQVLFEIVWSSCRVDLDPHHLDDLTSDQIDLLVQILMKIGGLPSLVIEGILQRYVESSILRVGGWSFEAKPDQILVKHLGRTKHVVPQVEGELQVPSEVTPYVMRKLLDWHGLTVSCNSEG